ncbi:hypothetical protein KC929_02940 [Patescibacteria group bacterium]|nr:hypothetical protein [Patescibacteria group bacterium]
MKPNKIMEQFSSETTNQINIFFEAHRKYQEGIENAIIPLLSILEDLLPKEIKEKIQNHIVLCYDYELPKDEGKWHLASSIGSCLSWEGFFRNRRPKRHFLFHPKIFSQDELYLINRAWSGYIKVDWKGYISLNPKYLPMDR